MKVTVTKENLAQIIEMLQSLIDGCGTVMIDCHKGRITGIRRQDMLRPRDSKPE